MTNCLVFDLGAGSGRAMLATYDGKKVELLEVHRFSGIELRLTDGPHWDFRRLLDEIVAGIKLTLARCGTLSSIGIDSWGLDYALVDEWGEIEPTPFHYRHPRSQQGYESFPLAPSVMFQRTGAQILPVNTAYQLHHARKDIAGRAAAGCKVLMSADAVAYYLTGRMAAEVTLARTSGLLAPSDDWDDEICAAAEIPRSVLPAIVQPGEIRGRLREELAAELGMDPIPVVAVASHDTASAVCGLPMGINDAFLVCGSWLILGKELDAPVISDEARLAGFGNEGGVARRPIFLRSLNGLHLIQKLQRSWMQHRGEDISFAEMSRAAGDALKSGSRVSIEPSDPIFFDPSDMVQAVRSTWSGSRHDEPDDLGHLTLAVYRGMVREIAGSLQDMMRLTGETVSRINICGGGGNDSMLCQLIADETNIVVRAGPIEASAWGNAIMQLIGLKLVENLQAGRELVEKSNQLLDYYPNKTERES